MNFLKWSLGLFFLCLIGCATQTPPPAQNATIPWNKRAETLSTVQNWNIKGEMAARTSKDAWSASIDWKQNHQNYQISLFGPLGSSSYVLTGTPNHVVLSGPNGKHATANSPEQLLYTQIGWRLPVSNLYYWVRGLPVPSMSAAKTFDSYQHLTELKQNDWTIQYLRYSSVNHIDVPTKIFMNNPALNVKIIINQWEF